MKRFIHGVVASFVAVFLTGASLAPAPAESAKPQILSHRALYKMTLDSVRNGAHISGASGQMFFEWADACNGWTTDQRMNLSLDNDEAGVIEMKSVFTTWEAKEGTRYRFNYRQTTNGETRDEFRGSATLTASGGTGTATYTFPEKKEVKLPEGSYFPTAHTQALITAAQSKQPLFSATIFDGTDENGYSLASSIIGPQRAIANDIAKTGLGSLPAIAWPVRMAFFPSDSQESAPDYEMDTTVLPNGVSEFLLLDYGEFKIRGTLEKLELLPKPDC